MDDLFRKLHLLPVPGPEVERVGELVALGAGLISSRLKLASYWLKRIT